ncbi:MAG TPA: DUF3422 family protein, partial [Nitrospiria bacterium]
EGTMKDAKQGDQAPIRRLHERPKKFLEEWLDFPAHIHQVAFKMADPPKERPRSQEEFLRILKGLNVPDENIAVSEKFGYGARIEENGDRLVIVWEAHTEYFNYHVWHIPDDKNVPLEFGDLAVPGFRFPLTPTGTRISALDIIISAQKKCSPEMLREMLPGPNVYGNRVYGEDIAVVTSFTPDEHLRERYLVYSARPEPLLDHLGQVVDAIVTIENYYHLLLLPQPEFAKAVDQIHRIEQHLLTQRAALTEELGGADSKKLQEWVNILTKDFMEVSRFAEAERFELSAAVPYNAIVHATVRSIQEKPLPPFFPLSDYVLSGISGVSDGYQQLIRRIEGVESDFHGIISVIRTKVSLMQQDQNLILADQNLSLLSNVDKTTKSQVMLQHTVEGLSVIVIAYYLSGLGSYVFKAMEKMGWLANADLATGIFVPVSILVSFIMVVFGRKAIFKWLGDREKN